MNLIATFTIATLTSILYFTIFWSISIKLKKAWVADIAWATGFFVVYFVAYTINKGVSFKQNLVFLLLLFWGIRLATYLIIRNFKKEDFRYQKLKEKWGEKWRRKSYLNIFIAQALVLIVINSGALLIAVYGKPFQITLLDYAAAAIWILGFLIESVADLQMFQFKSNPNNLNKIYKRGLWRYSRHPNYLGECIMWFAIFLLAVPLPYGLVGIASPILITLSLLKFTGINTVENKLKTNPEYLDYINKTPKFLPKFKKLS